MRLVCGLVLMAFVWMSPVLLGWAHAPAFSAPHLPSASDVLDVKFVCGDTPDGYRCRNESGAIRRGKMHKIPKRKSDESSGDSLWGGGGLWGGGDDAQPSAPAAGAASGGAAAASRGCPANSERLGGHCIPYTQSCKRGLAANAAPQACRSAQEKLICDFRSDGLKDCCCRTYSAN